jgi:hypothetical protein
MQLIVDLEFVQCLSNPKYLTCELSILSKSDSLGAKGVLQGP